MGYSRYRKGPGSGIFAPYLYCLAVVVWFCWPLCIHGPVGYALEMVWVPVSGFITYSVYRHRKPKVSYRVPSHMQQRKRVPLAPQVKANVWVRCDGRCQRCYITDEQCMAATGEHLQFDHEYPWSKGGSDDEDNIQLLCPPCNRSKGARVYY